MRTRGPAMRNRAVVGSSPTGGSRTGGTRAALIQHPPNRTKPADRWAWISAPTAARLNGSCADPTPTEPDKTGARRGAPRPVRQKRAPIHYANWVKGYFP
jgi:hypothetical protein